jgi:CHAD domain-containing protein
MAFCFKRNESTAKAIPRLACERIDRAIECLRDCARPEAVHGARKDMKKATAVLQLARAGIPKKNVRSIAKRLKKSLSCLSSARDAAIIAKTLRDLARRSKGQLESSAIREMRLQLQHASRKATKRLVKKGHAAKAKNILAKARKDFCELKIDGKGWDVVGRGVKKAYAKGQRAHQMALSNRSAEHFHEWRRAAKELWYELTMLHAISPEEMDMMARDLETLGEILGDDHDLFVLQCWLKERKHGRKTRKELPLLQRLIEARQRDLRIQALDIGKDFYAETPNAFCKRLEDYWLTWCDENAN